MAANLCRLASTSASVLSCQPQPPTLQFRPSATDPPALEVARKAKGEEAAGDKGSGEGKAEAAVEEEDNDSGVHVNKATGEIGAPRGPELVQDGDWEHGGRCSDF
uniref:Succinate dehydrogenase assembly factor 4, mitochondrial n=1 Tax=Setaria viridis TaxID=4556 RepID=A0A4V6D939_SETVI|nr:hypothetical protein SEVIR_5G024800v2 [Setaria viridis]